MGGAIDPRCAVVIASLAALLPACAVINAAGKECAEDEFECCGDDSDNDGDGETDCDDTDCFGVQECTGVDQCNEDTPVQDLGSFPVGLITVNTCDNIIQLSDVGAQTITCEPTSSVALYRFTNTANGARRICLDYAQVGRVSMAANACGTSEPGCLSTIDRCTVPDLGARDYFLLVPASASSCGPLQISIGLADQPEICLNGVDDGEMANQDCEDVACKGTPECDHPRGAPVETCNGIDDGQVMTFPTGAIDELACRCVNDTGCNNLPTGSLPPYVCHTQVGGGGVCAPPCDPQDWCPAFGLECGADKRCH